MEFKKTENLKTGKIRYYIDGKRVTWGIFEAKTDYTRYNSSYLYHSGIYRYSGYWC